MPIGVPAYSAPDGAPRGAALIPVDFFEVKAETKPKGSYRIMGVLTFTTLAATLTAFVYLAIAGSKTTITVSSIKTEDLSGTSGWDTCIMTRKVNDEYAIGNSSDYTLVNIMESESECLADMYGAAPCSSGNFGFVSTSSAVDETWGFSPYGAIAIDSSGNVWGQENVLDNTGMDTGI